MILKRTAHAVYDTEYHLVWTRKYGKWILRDNIREPVKEIFDEICRNPDLEIDTIEIADDRVHLFLSFPPRYSISGGESSGKMDMLPERLGTKGRLK